MKSAKLYNNYDVIVVGGGHAGIEAAHAAAQLGSRTLMITLDIEKIGTMPCNPAIGGVGKGHMVYELSALGGLMPKLCTPTYLQARMLNTRKGPAVQGLRLQIDKEAYNKLSVETLKNLPNLTLYGDMVDEILFEENNKKVTGVITADGSVFYAPTVILTTGTFLNGMMRTGDQLTAGGRRGENTVTKLAQFLRSLGLKISRLKTGTPPRLLRSSIDFSQLETQEGDDLEYLFEFAPHKTKNTFPCYITHTNMQAHSVILNNKHVSPVFLGQIEGIGPRYCPSVEDKIRRFANKESHHIFLEPESASSQEIYPNGMSTSMPITIQEEFFRSIKGLENVVILKPGYLVEYDFVSPDQLHHSLELKKITGLFLAGQINGTTGYEEAACQGFIAGVNAHLKAHNKLPFVLQRTESYIGVMIDDLVTLSVDEPYRMFTSRAERRIVLRQDNVFLRLTDKARALGGQLISDQLYHDFCAERTMINQALTHMRNLYSNTQLLKLVGEFECNNSVVRQLANNPLNNQLGSQLSERAVQNIYAEIRYSPYLEREDKEIQKTERYQQLIIPSTFDFNGIPGLSTELQSKLTHHRPRTIAQATLISGITPAAISLLIFKIRQLGDSCNDQSSH